MLGRSNNAVPLDIVVNAHRTFVHISGYLVFQQYLIEQLNFQYIIPILVLTVVTYKID
jgi:hypothetical protein